MSYAELSALDSAATSEDAPAASDADVWALLDNGIREISGEVRNSLDFHRSQDGGGEVSHIVLSGAAEEIPGFAEALELALGVEVRGETIAVADAALASHVSKHRLAAATGPPPAMSRRGPSPARERSRPQTARPPGRRARRRGPPPPPHLPPLRRRRRRLRPRGPPPARPLLPPVLRVPPVPRAPPVL